MNEHWVFERPRARGLFCEASVINRSNLTIFDLSEVFDKEVRPGPRVIRIAELWICNMICKKEGRYAICFPMTELRRRG